MPGWPLSEEAFDVEYARVAQIVADRDHPTKLDCSTVLVEMAKIHGQWVWQAAEEYDRD